MTPPLTTIYLVRHGESVWNMQKVLQGQHNSPLTKKGSSQAALLAQKFKDIKFEAVLSSDLSRAQQTAYVLLLKRRLAVLTTKALRERYFAKFEGKSAGTNKELRKLFADYEAAPPHEKWTMKTGGIESDEELVGRAITLLREVAVAYAGKKVLVVTHGGLMHLVLIHLGFATHDELHPWLISNLAYVILESDGVDFFVRKVKGIRKDAKKVLRDRI